MTPSEAAPRVSVCVITYNHERYIRECLQSILDQETEFSFEIIVGDDCSADSTRAIIREFESKFPGIVRPLFYETKVGGTQNYLQTHAAATGEYIAHVDGDDYCLPGKLQAQVEYLDAHPYVAIAAHAMRIAEGERLTTSVMGNDNRLPRVGTMNDLLRWGTYFAHSSVMYRRSNRFDHLNDRDYVDYYFYVEQASLGAIFLEKKPFGVYRRHPAGISQDPARRSSLERAYEEAFDRAYALGVPYSVVHSARLRRRMVFALARYSDGDVKGYVESVQIERRDLRYATLRHVLLAQSRRMPFLIDYYFMLRRSLPQSKSRT